VALHGRDGQPDHLDGIHEADAPGIEAVQSRRPVHQGV
jgi:hypothetical protein